MLKKLTPKNNKKLTIGGQTAIEYLLVLTIAVSFVLIAFTSYFDSVQEGGELYYNNVGVGILGSPPRCGDGDCSAFESNASSCCAADCSC